VKFRFLPKTEDFYDLFVEVSKRTAESAKLLRALLNGKPELVTYHVDAIRKLEHECDELTHEVVRRLDRTFITPIDREDIHLLATDLDDVIDCLDATARRAKIFRIGHSPEGVDSLCAVVEEITAEVLKAVTALRNGKDVMGHCIRAKQLEEEGDAVYHDMLGRLFDTETDPVRIIKWKEIFDNLETALDQAEDVANDIESIVLKHA
jgi:predicted phosphate transport protein (TIGR00153 family)